MGAVGCSNRTMKPKHTSDVAKEWLNQARIEVLEWPFVDLNPTENMWTVLRKRVHARKLINLAENSHHPSREVVKIQPKGYQELVGGHQKHPIGVKTLMGHLTKY